MPELLPELAKRLQQVASFEIASFSLYDPEKNNANALLGGQWTPFWPHRIAGGTIGLRLRAGKTAADGGARPAAGNPVSARGKSSRKKKAWDLTTRCPSRPRKKRFGALGLGSSRLNAYHDDDLHLLRGVAELVALALENAMTREGKVLSFKIAEAGEVLGLSAEIAGEPFELTPETPDRAR
jgi:hypothetical protein